MRLYLLSAAAILALTACGKAGNETNAAPAAEQQAQLTSPPLGEDRLPRFKPGLWEVAKTDGDTEVTQECMGAELDPETRAFFTRQSTPDCKIQRSDGLGGLKISGECKQGDLTIQSQFVMTGSETAYDMKLGTYVVKPDGARDGGDMFVKARWIGACPPGVKPGETVGEVAGE